MASASCRNKSINILKILLQEVRRVGVRVKDLAGYCERRASLHVLWVVFIRSEGRGVSWPDFYLLTRLADQSLFIAIC